MDIWIAWMREDGTVDLINVDEHYLENFASFTDPREIIFEARLVTE